MRDYLPKELIESIRERYITGVSDAEQGFHLNEDDEDSLTGAFGQAISTTSPRRFETPEDIYIWEVQSFKIRGKGPGAPERKIGADAIFQVRIIKNGELKFDKMLPFQAKKNRESITRQLRNQSKKMLQEIGNSVVIDYSRDGYTGFPAAELIKKHKEGTRPQSKALSHLLGDDFINCDVGIKGLHYDPTIKKFESSIQDETTVIDTRVESFTK